MVARNTLLRTGVLQILANVVPNVALHGFAYTDLDSPQDAGISFDLLLLSVASPERQPSLVQACLKVFSPRIIVLMAEGPPNQASIESLPKQVVGYIDKSSEPEVFIDCVRRVLSGQNCFPWTLSRRASDNNIVSGAPDTDPMARLTPALNLMPPVASSIFNLGASASPATPTQNEADLLGLTPRQYEVLVLLSRGLSLKLVARQLNISLGTTKAHTEAVYQRLGAHNRNEAVYIARNKGATLEWDADDDARQGRFFG